MTGSYKPDGYTSVAPYLMVDDARREIDFLKATFDAEELRRFDGPDGRVMHAEVRIGDTVVMMSDGNADFPPFPIWIHVYVPDVDETWRRALEAGGEAVQEPVRKEDPDRRGGVRDPSGNTWWIATQKADG